jgi:hypothetical protein
MTKQEEIQILTRAAAELGPDSYLGPWLTSILGELERDIRSDILPTIMLAEARARCFAIMAEAGLKAVDIRTAAFREADNIRAAANKDAAEARTRAAVALRAALQTITE